MTVMAYVLGTSACTMASSVEPIFIPGVWGPYDGAMVPGLWLNEGGQSSAGAAIDQIVALHPAALEARALAASRGQSVPDLLADLAVQKTSSLSDAVRLAGDLVVVPDFLGNRSPHADPDARAVIAGLGMERDLENLVGLYVAGILGLGYGLRQIIESSRAKGAVIDAVALSGGAGRHPLVRQLLADCTGVPVSVSQQEEPVLLGAAMLGAMASGTFTDLGAAMREMTGATDIVRPASSGFFTAQHGQRFAAFEFLQKAARNIRIKTTEN
jgi:D-ribulokinase